MNAPVSIHGWRLAGCDHLCRPTDHNPLAHEAYGRQVASFTTPVGETIGQRIAERRRRLGWTQYDLAAEVGVQRFTVGRWESGMARPSAASLVRLAAVLATPAAALWSQP